MDESDQSYVPDQDTAQRDKVTFAGKEVNFKEPREKLVIEFGHGGGAMLANRQVLNYLKESSSNYLGIEKDIQRSRALTDLLPIYPWADSSNKNIFDAKDAPSPNIADEIWMRNFLIIGKDDDTYNRWQELASIAYQTLKPGGKVAFFDDYTRYDKTEVEEITERFRKEGFEVQSFDPNKEEHPIVSRSSSLANTPHQGHAVGFFALKSED